MIAKTPVTLDLDSLEREGSPEPFIVTLGGKQYTLRDPNGVHWQDLTGNRNEDESRSHYLIRTVEESRREAFTTAIGKLPLWKIEKLAESYNKHYAMPDEGEGGASPTS